MGRPDHPRACGANKYTSSAFSPVPGSSPRVRGKRVPGTRPPVFVRSIPAHAGQTVSPRIQTTCPSDHPRACGANIEHLERQQRKYRSSPRVRGKLFLPFFACAGIRIIPARAGQTARRCRAAPERPDHPRACGANGKAFHTEENLPGSSPRVRGKRRHWGGGILASDHPRACGANSSSRCVADCSTGSSPRAGQTNSTSNWMCGKADHPRACGANSGLTYLVPSVAGSSPRVRGKRILGSLLRVGCRIIPARAGQTSGPRNTKPSATDHPRACGANSLSKTCMFPLSGSSPRVRGKLAYARRRRRPVRIIPARAGQTRGRS